MERRRKGTSRTTRLVWGGVALLLAAGLGMSFILARNALHDEERSAQIRAGFLTTNVLSGALTPSMVNGPITGASYRDLLVVVQQEILSDDRMVRVRVWKPDGTLIFSTDQRDRIGQTFGAIEEKIQPTIKGETFSEVTAGPVAPKVGLNGSSERVYQTFVPLHIDTRLGVVGAVQIEQRYALIRGEAIGMWRPAQIGLGVALAVAIALLALSFRPRTVGRVAGFEPGRAGASEKALQAEAREAQGRLRRAEEAARQAQARLAASEGKVQELSASSRALELKLGETEGRIPEVEAELARTREELRRLTERPAPEPPTPEIQVELQKSYSRLQQLEAELQKAGERAALAERRAAQAEAQVAEAGERVRVVEAERA
ncbi:MAG: hypothetical protein HYU54_05510, partial [Actinobacteria bacterium]|nr:hypothetical protein [Actinomycetota bacterium]